MKKILWIFAAVLLLFTACSPEVCEKAGEWMGKMNTNVYGIQANLKDVDTAVETLDSTVEGTTVTLSAENAASIVESVIVVANSQSKTEALKESFTEPVIGAGATDEEKAAVKASIIAVVEENKISDEEIAGYSAERQMVAEAINEILAEVSAGLSDNPTKGELATVAVIKTMADAVKNDADYIEAGFSALSALKITTEAATIDILANIDVTAFLNSMSDKGVSKGNELLDGMAQYFPATSKTITQLVDCLTENGKFSVQRYNKFIMECKAIKTAYEFMAKDLEIDLTASLDQQVGSGKSLTIEDLGRYLVASAFVIADDLVDTVTATLTEFINSNFEILEDLDAEDMGIFDEFNYEEFEEFQEFILIDNPTFCKILKTTGMILIDSEYHGLLKLGGKDGSLAGLLN